MPQLDEQAIALPSYGNSVLVMRSPKDTVGNTNSDGAIFVIDVSQTK